MNRFIVFTMLLICLFLVTACSSNEIIDNREKNNEIKNEAISEVDESKSSNDTGENDVVKNETNDKDDEFSSEMYYQSEQYSIAPSELLKKDMNRPEDNSEWLKSLAIRYPQIYNLEDNQRQSRINDFLYSKVMSYHNILSEREYINYILDYKIMSANDDTLSILFYGEVEDYQTENSFAFATTLNLETEKEVLLKDYIIINDSFVEDFLFSKFDIVENKFEDIHHNIPFIEQFVLTYNKNVHVNDFYVKDNTIGIIVPTHNSMGYVLIEGNIEK